jgi:hypothetical protein
MTPPLYSHEGEPKPPPRRGPRCSCTMTATLLAAQASAVDPILGPTLTIFLFIALFFPPPPPPHTRTINNHHLTHTCSFEMNSLKSFATSRRVESTAEPMSNSGLCRFATASRSPTPSANSAAV